jgi:hypothetical protein
MADPHPLGAQILAASTAKVWRAKTATSARKRERAVQKQAEDTAARLDYAKGDDWWKVTSEMAGIESRRPYENRPSCDRKVHVQSTICSPSGNFLPI